MGVRRNMLPLGGCPCHPYQNSPLITAYLLCYFDVIITSCHFTIWSFSLNFLDFLAKVAETGYEGRFKATILLRAFLFSEHILNSNMFLLLLSQLPNRFRHQLGSFYVKYACCASVCLRFLGNTLFFHSKSLKHLLARLIEVTEISIWHYVHGVLHWVIIMNYRNGWKIEKWTEMANVHLTV